MRFVDLKIRTKLLSAFAVLIVFGLLISVSSVAYLLYFKKSINSFSREFLPQLELSSRLSNETQRIAFNMEGYYLTGKTEYFRLARLELDSLKRTSVEAEMLLEGTKNLSTLEQNLSEVRILIPQYEQIVIMAFKTVQDINYLQTKIKKATENTTLPKIVGKKAKLQQTKPVNVLALQSELVMKNAALQDLRKKDAAISGKLKQNADNLRISAISYTDKVATDFGSSVNLSVIIQLIIVLLTMSFSIFTAVYVSRLITQPLMGGIYFAQRIAGGDLTADLNIERKDEIGVLASNLHEMSSKIRDIISHVASTAQNLSGASHELSSTSHLVSQGASEQASSAEEVSAAIEEMAANIQQNRENARQTEQLVMKAESDMYVGSEQVLKTVDAMREIANKTSIIGDIAFQTNILALNAAVEAARAGEHGRGFGVVAAEVGKLAERSKLAAMEIDQLLKTSVKNAEEAGKLMRKIVPDIQKTSQLVQEISAASLEQSAGADQINVAIQELNGVTQQNAATSEELSTNAVELSAQSEKLMDIISFFNTGDVSLTKNQERKGKVSTESNVETPAGVRRGILIDLDQPDVTDDDFERF